MAKRDFPSHSPHLASRRPSLDIPAALKIAGIYLLVGGLWIFWSDRLVGVLLHRQLDLVTHLQTFKGWFYVIVTAAMLYGLVHRETQASQHINANLKQTLAELLSAQAALQENQERFNLAVSGTNDGVWDWDLRSDRVFYSPVWMKILGDREPMPPVFSSWSDRIHPDDVDAALQSIHDSLQGQTSHYRHVHRIRHQTGQWRWIEAKGRCVRDTAGLPYRLTGTITDITDRKRTEATLYQREQEFRALAENAPDLIIRCDRNLTFLYVNPMVEWVTGESPHHFIGQSYQTFGLDEAALAQWQHTLTHVLTTGQQQSFDFQYPTPHGQRDYQARCVPEFAADSTVASVLMIARDTTEQKQLERELRQRIDQEQSLSRILQAIRQSLDLESIFTSTTLEIAQQIHADRTAVVQYLPDRSCWKHIAEYRHLPTLPDLLGTEIPDQNNAIAAQLKQLQIVRVDNPDTLKDAINREMAHIFPGSWLVVPLIVDHKLWGSLSLFRSQHISPWTEAQATLVQTMADQLAIAIQQAQAFAQAQTELAERQQVEAHLRTALTEKEVLLKEIHHRVKNNLQIVSGLLQLQAQRVQDPQIESALRESQTRVEAMSLIHKKLYASSELGQIDVADYIQSLATSLLSTYHISPNHITLAIDVESVILNLDQAIPCGLIINEVISNALKYAFPQGQPGEIYVKFFQSEEILVLIIQDNGIGLPNTVDWHTPPTLGLSLVYALVTEQLEGTLNIDHSQGTTFTIQFPQFIPRT